MILFDASHTSHTRAQTGIQRVCRSLHAALGEQQPVLGICYDPYLRAWRPLSEAEARHLQPGQAAGGSRGARWQWSQRLTSHARRLVGRAPSLPAADALVCPELFTTRVGAHLAEIFAAVRGPRVAIFHDAIGLKFPELTPTATVARLPVYLRELLRFDGVAAVSEDSAASLRDYWRWLGLTDVPPVQAIPNGIDPCPIVNERPAPPPIQRVLCVGTIEGRKNHLALLEACAGLWQAGLKFELQLLGLARPDTASGALAMIRSLQQAGWPLLYRGTVPDTALHAAYRACSFTVYPSLLEGFGLPVLESLQHGRPCVCSAHGALGESARGGGCVMLESVDSASLSTAIGRLLRDPGEIDALAQAAQQRTFRSWTRQARELTAWMQTLPRRD